jgi:ribose 5-phosphate isomerase B
MLIFIGSDHAGFHHKEKLIGYLEELGHEVVDKGPYKLKEDDDYVDFAVEVAQAVADFPEENRGIIIGGSGQGEAIVSNRFPGIRAMVFYGPRVAEEAVDISGKKSEDPFEPIRLAREHNNANILSLGARFVTLEEARQAAKLFLETPFSNERRHKRRVEKIDNLDASHGSEETWLK